MPEVDCMEDRVKVLFHTEKPFTGRIFVKGMVDKSQCVNSFDTNSKSNVQFEIANGECNMRRSRKVYFHETDSTDAYLDSAIPI